MNGAVLLIAGGSGIVPLMAMIRHRTAAASHTPMRLLYSSRTRDDVIYYDELEKLRAQRDGLEVFHTLTRGAPAGWQGFTRRIDREMLDQVANPLGSRAQVFICGPTPLVEAAANTCVQIGIPAVSVRTERFGPSGN
jgi:ferredoxin-NADP reductase